jgi:trans-aconitate methyltransferase
MKDVIESFDRAAGSYERHAQPQAALATELANWISPAEKKGRALELGAGTGLFTRWMLPWAGTYTATDAAPKMVELGRARCPSAHWKVLDARALDSQEEVNWVFACSLLQWMPDPQAVLQNWRNFLTADGKLLLAVLLPGTLGELQSILPEAKPLNWHPAAEWRSMAEAAGFAIEREQTSEQQILHPNSLELLRAVHAMGVAPQHAVGPGRLRVALRIYNEKYATAGGVQSTWRAWLVRAQVR